MDLLVGILEKTISPDANELEHSKRVLEEQAQQNLPEFLKQLSEVLKNASLSPVARTQAGLQLKNALYSKDPTIKIAYQTRWLQFPDDVRTVIKNNVLASLGTECHSPSSAAQCVANIACAELPRGLWGELIGFLCEYVTMADSTRMLKQACLEAVGYICQDIEPEILQSQSNKILTAIVFGMKKEEPSHDVRYAAANALLNSLEFTKANFALDEERHFIMQVVCEATQSPDIRTKVVALQCLVKIMSLYYQYMECYMKTALFPITVEAMKSPEDEIALQGIEFWSSVCDEEVDLAIELSEAAEAGRPPERTSRFYAKGALPHIVPILLSTLTKQEEGDDDDEWNPCKAAGVCLMLMASCCEDDILQHVIPFVTCNINHAEWRFREASVMAFGSILEGPDPNKLKPVVEQGMGELIARLKDSSVVVRDTTAWTIGRVCEILPEAVINIALDQLLEVLVQGLASEPRVSSNVCWAFSSLAEAAIEHAEQPDDGTDPETYCLSKFFKDILHALFVTADRPDGNQNNLRNAAYEAIMELIKNSPKDCYPFVKDTLLEILQKLSKVIENEAEISMSSDRWQYNDLTSLLCATLQSVLRKITRDDAIQISDDIMKILMHMLSTSCGKSGGVQEDALLAISTLTEVVGENFLRYMPVFQNFLFASLKNHAEYQVSIAAVGLVGDLCRALGEKVQPFTPEIMVCLRDILRDDSVHRSVKPPVLSVFGDIALAIGPSFRDYVDVVLEFLHQATQAQVDKSDYDLIDYLNELREGCLEAYTGIIQGLKGDSDGVTPEIIQAQFPTIGASVPHMISFIEIIAIDEDHSDSNVASCCGLIGDLCTTFGGSMLPLVDKEPITTLLTQGRRSKANKCKTLATWATKEIRKLRNAAQS